VVYMGLFFGIGFLNAAHVRVRLLQPVEAIFNPGGNERVTRAIQEFQHIWKKQGMSAFTRRLNRTWGRASPVDEEERSASLAALLLLACHQDARPEHLERFVGHLFNGLTGRNDALRCYVESSRLLDMFAPRWRKAQTVAEWKSLGSSLFHAWLETQPPGAAAFEDPLIRRLFQVRPDLHPVMFRIPVEMPVSEPASMEAVDLSIIP